MFVVLSWNWLNTTNSKGSMSIARVFAHLIECSDRCIPFQTLQTLLSVKSFRALAQISLKKYLSSLSSLSADLLQISLKKLYSNILLFYRQMPCIRGGTFCSELVYYSLSQCWRKERFEISRCVEFLVVVTINLCPLSISPGTRRKCSLVGSIEVCQRSASHLANSDIQSHVVWIFWQLLREIWQRWR